MKKRREIRNLCLRQIGERRHAFGGIAKLEKLPQFNASAQITLNGARRGEVRADARSARIGAVTESAIHTQKLSPACGRSVIGTRVSCCGLRHPIRRRNSRLRLRLDNRREGRDGQRDVNSAESAVRSAALAAASNTQIGSPDQSGATAMRWRVELPSLQPASRPALCRLL
jgi:hypothetical protein